MSYFQNAETRQKSLDKKLEKHFVPRRTTDKKLKSIIDNSDVSSLKSIEIIHISEIFRLS